MRRFKVIGKNLLFPPIVVGILLTPVAVVSLVYSLLYLRSDSVIAIVSYVLSFYTLIIWSVKIPKLIRWFQYIKKENRYVQRWSGDVRLRVRISLYGAGIWNSAYGILQFCLGMYHASVWYYSLAGYYICLALLRLFLSRYTAKHQSGEKMRKELMAYRTCGWVFLVINLALSAMVFLMIYQNRTTHHHPITSIALAAYTFTSLTVAIIRVIRYRKYNSPVYSASKAISLASASVSMITLTSTMLSSFWEDVTPSMFRTIMLAGLGAVVAVLITTMAFFMIARANKEIKRLGESS